MFLGNEQRELVVIDTETTGFNPHQGHVIVEVAGERIRGDRVTDRFQAILRQDVMVPYGAERVHGITTEMMILEGRTPTMVMKEFREFIGGAVIVGHNVAFDLAFLHHHNHLHGVDPLANEALCTMILSRQYLILPNYSLPTVARYLRVPHPAAHRAMADVETTRQVFLRLTERAKKLELDRQYVKNM